MEQEESLLLHTEILSLEYESENSTVSSTLLVFTSQPPTPLPLSSSLSPSTPTSPPPPYKMSQHDLHTIIRQQQEQLAAMQAQLQALVERGVEGRATMATISTEVARPQIFDGTLSKVSGFITTCRLYLRMKIRGMTVEEQIQ